MNKEQFLKAVQRLRDDGYQRKVGPRGQIRYHRNHLCLCPIEAVAYQKHQRYFGDVGEAAQSLKLSVGLMNAVILTADHQRLGARYLMEDELRALRRYPIKRSEL